MAKIKIEISGTSLAIVGDCLSIETDEDPVINVTIELDAAMVEVNRQTVAGAVNPPSTVPH